MTENERDDAPQGYRLSRRRILVGGGVLLAGAGTGIAVATNTPQPTGADAASRFMTLSSLLIQHRLDARVGQRLAVAMGIANRALPQQVEQLLRVAESHHAKVVEDFFHAIPEGLLKTTALAIISAWYVGVIVDAPDAEVFSYELALLFQPTRDVMTIPTYAISGPNGWNADAPPLADMPVF